MLDELVQFLLDEIAMDGEAGECLDFAFRDIRCAISVLAGPVLVQMRMSLALPFHFFQQILWAQTFFF